MSRYTLATACTAAMMSFACHSAAANTDPLAFYQPASPQQESVARRAATQPRARGRGDASGLGGATQDVIRLAAQMGVPQALALSVCRIESRCRYGLVGRQGERGPLQIKLQTARGLGYSGTAGGLNGPTGAYWGMRHLAEAYRRCGTARGAAKLHNAGLAASCSGSGYASRVMARM
ncbi:MAG: hypothetical protein ACRCTI_16455 [Beijerinckiaceae bacterium]